MNSLPVSGSLIPDIAGVLWQPWMVLLWAGSDLLIFAAYMAIPLAIVLVLRRRADLAHRGLVSLFAAFILLCGLTHALGIIALWYPIETLSGLVKLATGIVSVVTAIVLFRLIPIFVRIPTPDRHEEVIAQLEVTLADLSVARDELENRVNQRTAELARANDALEFTARDAVQRSRNLIQVVSSLTRPGAQANEYSEGFLRELRGRINALAIATSTVMEQDGGACASLERVIRRQVEPLFANPGTQLSTDGPLVEIGAQGAQQVSLVAWELGSRFAQLPKPEQDRARVFVTWSIAHREGQDDQMTIEWREKHGAAMPVAAIVPDPFSSDCELQDNSPAGPLTDIETPEPLTGFSETLLTRIVPRLLGGKGRIDLEHATLVYTLTCPLHALDNSRDAESKLTAVMPERPGRLPPERLTATHA